MGLAFWTDQKVRCEGSLDRDECRSVEGYDHGLAMGSSLRFTFSRSFAKPGSEGSIRRSAINSESVPLLPRARGSNSATGFSVLRQNKTIAGMPNALETIAKISRGFRARDFNFYTQLCMLHNYESQRMACEIITSSSEKKHESIRQAKIGGWG